jgi:hypothetical protein
MEKIINTLIVKFGITFRNCSRPLAREWTGHTSERDSEGRSVRKMKVSGRGFKKSLK